MFKKILVALDDSPCSERAGYVGLEFAEKLGAKLVFAHVLQTAPVPFGLGPNDVAYSDRAEELLRGWSERADAAHLPSSSIYTHSPEVPESLVYLAQEHGCDLIVMGTHGREGLSRVFLGSVAERVSRLSPVPVLLVREGGRPGGAGLSICRILAPVDGSQEGRPAALLAGRLAALLDAELHLVFVVPSLIPLADPYGIEAMAAVDYEQLETALEAQGKAVLEAVRAEMEAVKARTELVHTEHQREAQAIVEYAREGGFDLIVMGTHGRTGLDHLLLGSVAEGVTHHAGVPVLLVRPSQFRPAPAPEKAASVAR